MGEEEEENAIHLLPFFFIPPSPVITVASGPEMLLCCVGQSGPLIQRWKLQISCERDKRGTQGL